MRSIKVLVVEDFEPFRKFVVSTLQQKAGFQVTGASDGLEALQKIEEQQADLVLLDSGLPNLNGTEVAKRLRRLAVPPKIIFISQECSPEVVGEALYLGALGYVNKLRTHSDLLPAIEAVLEGKYFVSRDLQIGGGMGAQAKTRHEILFCSDATVLLGALADFISDALKSGNAALVRASKSWEGSAREELQARGVDMAATIQRGTYAFRDVDEPPGVTPTSDVVKRLTEAASKAGKKNPRVAVWSELTGRLWAAGKIDEAIQLEQRANDLAKHHDIDILCPYPLPLWEKDRAAFIRVCREHSVVSLR